MIYLYAFIDDFQPFDLSSGVSGEAIAVIEIESIRVATGQIARRPDLSAGVLAAQDRIVRELQGHAAAVLPLRFGATFAGEDDAARAIRTRKPALIEGLALVRGREQMTLWITQGARSATGATGATAFGLAHRSDEVAKVGPGSLYLRQRASAVMPEEITQVIDALRGLQRATRVEAGRTAGVVATVYQLIDRGTSEEYVRAVREIGLASPHLSIRVTGPSPCYAFA